MEPLRDAMFYVVVGSFVAHAFAAWRSAYLAACYSGKFDIYLFVLMGSAQYSWIRPGFVDNWDLQAEYEIAMSYSRVPLIVGLVSFVTMIALANR